MRYKIICILAIFIFSPGIVSAQFFDNLLQKGVESLSQDKPLSEIGTSLSEETIISGLKEALEVGVGRSIDFTSKLDGYIGNPKIKIPMPEKIQNVADMLAKVGFQKSVDDFTLSMNRAAEAASPKAKEYLLNAITQMSFDDAKKVLEGDQTHQYKSIPKQS